MPSEIRRELQVLREVVLATSASLDAEAVLRAVEEHARSLLEADYGAVLPAGHGGTELLSGEGPGSPAFLRELAREVVRKGEMCVARELPEALRSALAVPLRYGDEVHGVLLAAWREPHPLPAETTDLAETLAVHAAVALHNVRLYDALRRSTAAREQFFSAMSHDLRTPIAAIVGYSELLADGIAGELSEAQQEMVGRISQVAAQLTELVDDVLDLARLDAGRVELELEPVPLGELVGEAVLAVEPQARSKGLPLRLELDDAGGRVLRVDRGRVRQILVNLLSNAVKFTEEGEVRVLAGVRGPRSWITVRDTGPGLPEGSEEAVFEEFLQLASGRGSKRRPGSGLGLAVSRRLARAMGGDLTVESTPGVGAAFTLLLPVCRE